MTRLFTLIILLPLSFNSFAIYSGNDVIYDCTMLMDTEKMNNVTDFGKASMCGGYLNGLNDMVLVFMTVYGDVYCPPEGGIETGQLILITTKWLKENPEMLSESMRSVFIRVLRDAFPCDK